MDWNRLRINSLDEDENHSGHSYGPRHSAFNSDSEYSGSRSVRDMIKHYDSAWKKDCSSTANSPSRQHKTMARRQSHQNLLARNCGPVARPTHIGILDGCQKNGNNNTSRCCKNCTACMCCQNRSRISSAAIKALQSHDNDSDVDGDDDGNPNVEDVVVAGNTAMQKSLEFKDNFGAHRPLNAPNVMEKNRLLSTDSVEEANCHPIETSYQSKTTIAKTASGVRIIIDIFFDQERCVNAADVLGSRVETDLPQSRILNEFQQQAHGSATATATATATAASATTRNCSYLS